VGVRHDCECLISFVMQSVASALTAPVKPRIRVYSYTVALYGAPPGLNSNDS
jgi:hypothetical protein